MGSVGTAGLAWQGSLGTPTPARTLKASSSGGGSQWLVFLVHFSILNHPEVINSWGFLLLLRVYTMCFDVEVFKKRIFK